MNEDNSLLKVYQSWLYDGTEFNSIEDNSALSVEHPSCYTPEHDREMFACFRANYKDLGHKHFAVLFCSGRELSRSEAPPVLYAAGWTIICCTGEGGFGWYWVSR